MDRGKNEVEEWDTEIQEDLYLDGEDDLDDLDAVFVDEAVAPDLQAIGHG